MIAEHLSATAATVDAVAGELYGAVFSGGSGNCGPRGGPAVNNTANATPTPAQKPCTSIIVADATTGEALVVDTTGGGDVQPPAAGQTP